MRVRAGRSRDALRLRTAYVAVEEVPQEPALSGDGDGGRDRAELLAGRVEAKLRDEPDVVGEPGVLRRGEQPERVWPSQVAPELGDHLVDRVTGVLGMDAGGDRVRLVESEREDRLLCGAVEVGAGLDARVDEHLRGDVAGAERVPVGADALRVEP